MQKISTLFVRDMTTRLVTREVTPGCEWVQAGEGVAYRKWNGTCCLVQGGKLFRRYDAKKGRTPPADFVPAQKDADPVTGHWPGWIPVGAGKEDKWHRLAFFSRASWEDGTYELIGPNINRNPDRVVTETLMRHTVMPIQNAPTDWDTLKRYLEPNPFEGIVWHHPDGRMAKIKVRDFWGGGERFES